MSTWSKVVGSIVGTSGYLEVSVDEPEGPYPATACVELSETTGPLLSDDLRNFALVLLAAAVVMDHRDDEIAKEIGSACPYCGAIAVDMQAEVKHMEAAHPQVVAERMRRAGFVLTDGKWVDAQVDR